MLKATRKTDQYALVAFLIDHAAQANLELGKKALQKKVHLIQELGGVESGYRFSFYTYGPYSRNLAGDLDVIANSGGAIVSYDSFDNRYQIGAGEFTSQMMDRRRRATRPRGAAAGTAARARSRMGKEFVEANRSSIEKVIDTFGRRSAKGLELISTIAHLHRHLPEKEFQDDERLAERVAKLKPKYSESEIGNAIGEVRDFLSK